MHCVTYLSMISTLLFFYDWHCFMHVHNRSLQAFQMPINSFIATLHSEIKPILSNCTLNNHQSFHHVLSNIYIDLILKYLICYFHACISTSVHQSVFMVKGQQQTTLFINGV